MNLLGEFRVGEDIAIALDAVTGDPDTVDTVTAKMRPAEKNGGTLEINHAADAIDLTVTARDATDDDPAGWTLSLAAAATAELDPGYYAIDARIAVGSGVDITDTTAFIQLSQAVL